MELSPKAKNILTTAGNFIYSFITAVVAIVAVIFVLIKLLGWHMFSVDSPSMSPRYPVDTLVIVQDASPEEIKAYYQSDTTVDTVDALVAAIADDSITETIIVSSDIVTDTTITVPADKEVTLGLAGNTITNETAHAFVVEDGGELTISDGIVDATARAKAAVYNNAGGTVTLENVTLTRSAEAGASASNNGGNSYYVILNHGTMTINEGVTVSADGKYSSLVENGWQNGSQNSDAIESKLVINGGSFTGGLNTIKNDDYGVLEINGGYFENNAQYCVMNWNVTTINGGTFVTTKNSVVYNSKADDVMDKGELTVTGGSFSVMARYYVIFNSTAYGHGPVAVSGGTFNSKYVCNKGYLAAGYQLTDNGDGTYSVVVE